MKTRQSQSANRMLRLSKSITKGIIVWQLFQTIDIFSINPHATGVWIFGSLAMSIIFSIFLRKPTDLLFGIIIAGYVVFIDRLPSVPALLYFSWSFYRLDIHRPEKNAHPHANYFFCDARFAGIFRRATASTIDLLIFVLLITPFAIAVGGLAANTKPLNPYHQWINIFIVLMFLLVSAAMESSLGATIGKKAMGLSVVNTHGEKITFAAALIRNFIKTTLWTAPIYLFPDMEILTRLILGLGQIGIFIFSAFTDKHQALYDIFANSVVLHCSSTREETASNIIIS